MGNGPEFISDSLRDWCKEQHIQANYCDPGSPWQNARLESFNSRIRDVLLTREVLDPMWEIIIMLEEHRNNCNRYRPHGVLGLPDPN
jgi:putative transposase